MNERRAVGPKLSLVKARRQAKRYNLRDLAKKVGVSRQAILDYENGIYPPNPEVWPLLKDVLKLPGEPEDYWGREGGSANAPRSKKQKKPCSEKDCEGKAVAKGLCWRHYQRVKYWERKNKETGS